MPRFPVDVPKTEAVRTLEILGFRIVREANHISMVRENPDWKPDTVDYAETSSH